MDHSAPLVHYWDNRLAPTPRSTLCGRPIHDFSTSPDTDKYLVGWVTPAQITCNVCRDALPADRTAAMDTFIVETEQWTSLPTTDELRRRWAIEQAVAWTRYGAPQVRLAVEHLSEIANALIAYVLDTKQPSSGPVRDEAAEALVTAALRWRYRNRLRPQSDADIKLAALEDAADRVQRERHPDREWDSGI